MRNRFKNNENSGQGRLHFSHSFKIAPPLFQILAMRLLGATGVRSSSRPDTPQILVIIHLIFLGKNCFFLQIAYCDENPFFFGLHPKIRSFRDEDVFFSLHPRIREISRIFYDEDLYYGLHSGIREKKFLCPAKNCLCPPPISHTILAPGLPDICNKKKKK